MVQNAKCRVKVSVKVLIVNVSSVTSDCANQVSMSRKFFSKFCKKLYLCLKIYYWLATYCHNKFTFFSIFKIFIKLPIFSVIAHFKSVRPSVHTSVPLSIRPSYSLSFIMQLILWLLILLYMKFPYLFSFLFKLNNKNKNFKCFIGFYL